VAKSTRQFFSSAANKLAAERKLYDFEFMCTPMTLETIVAELKSETAQCVAAILKRGRLVVQHQQVWVSAAGIATG
jgi:hypothetical protein